MRSGMYSTQVSQLCPMSLCPLGMMVNEKPGIAPKLVRLNSAEGSRLQVECEGNVVMPHFAAAPSQIHRTIHAYEGKACNAR